MLSCSRWPLGSGGPVDASNQTIGRERTKRHWTAQTGQENGNRVVSGRICLLFLYDAASATREPPERHILAKCVREASPPDSPDPVRAAAAAAAIVISEQ